MTGNRAGTAGIRLAAWLVLLLGLAAGTAQGYLAWLQGRNGWILGAQACFYAATGLGFWGILWALAAIIKRGPGIPPEITRQFWQINQSLEQVSEMLSRQQRPAVPAPGEDDAGNNANALHQILKLLQNIRDVSLLSDEQKRARAKRKHPSRKVTTMQEVAESSNGQNMSEASQLPAAVETQLPGDSSVSQSRETMDVARTAVEAETFVRTRAQVEDLMAASSWDEAMSLMSQFSQKYPANAEGRKLLARITRERDSFRENASQRLYEAVKHDVERRNWRRALAGAHRLIENFPEQPRCEKVRVQLATIQDNAEIEERQEFELRIQDLLKTRHFAEAIEMAEDVLLRFPNSPQAHTLKTLIPKMRKMMQQEKGDVITG